MRSDDDEPMAAKKHSDTPVASRFEGSNRCAPGARRPAGARGVQPGFDWRSVPLPDTQLVAELPCRPGRFQRDVTVAGTPLKLFMLSCEAGGVTYGVATAEVGDPPRVDAVLHGAARQCRVVDPVVRFGRLAR